MSNSKSSPKNIILWCFVLISLVLSSVSLIRTFLPGKNSVAVVDAVRLISSYKGLDDIKRTQQERNQQLQANLDTLRSELRTSIDEYERTKATSTKKVLTLMEEVVQTRQRNLITYEQSVNDQVKKQDEELANKLLAKVNEYVKRYGEKNGYTIILANTQIGNIAYAEDRIDITDEVLKGLNSEYVSTH
jgi:outer membrane protein